MIRRVALWAIILLAIAVPLAGIILRPTPALTANKDLPGLLAERDLDDADYALVVSFGDERGALRMDDEALIAAHRETIDVNVGFADFMPGEGRGGIYLYAFRNGEKIAGRVVSQANQINMPQAVLQAARPVTQQRLEANRAQTEASVERLRGEEALLDLSGMPSAQEIGHEFYFRVPLPTIAVADGADFDARAYAQVIAERIRTALGEADYDLAVELIAERPPRTFSLFDEAGNVLYDEIRNARHLPLTLYDYSATIRGEPSLREDFVALSLPDFVADRRNQQAIIDAWEAVVGKRPSADEIYIDSYDATGRVGPIIEQTYTLTYWE